MKKHILIWILLLIGFCAMEFPGVFFFGNISQPFILGMPFIYGYMLCFWAYMCGVFWYAHKCNWGRKRIQETGKGETKEDDG